MFFSPAQRAQLDIARTQRARTTLATEKTEEDANAAPAPQTITYDGAVRRSDGKTTVWLNGRPVNDKDPAGGALVVGRVRPDGGISLQMPQSGRTVNLKPGQSIELLSGAIEESFSRKPVTAPEVKPAPKSATEEKSAAGSASSERVAVERDREEQQRKMAEALRVLQESAGKPGTKPPSVPQNPPR